MVQCNEAWSPARVHMLHLDGGNEKATSSMYLSVHLLDLRVDAPIAPTPLLLILAYACQLHQRESSAGKGGGGRPTE